MTMFRNQLWIGALMFGIAFLALGIFFVVEGFNAKDTIRIALAEEMVTTSDEAVQFGVPAGVLVQNAETAEAQANVIEMHSVDRYGRYAEMERDDPNRPTYITGLTLRNALSLAVMGFGIADLAIGTGVMIILMGVLSLGIGVPALYWARDAEQKVVRQASQRLAHAPAGAAD